MATTPRHNTRRPGSNPETPPSQKRRLDGLFREGQWFCNCEPRQPASLLQVRKNKPTKGRWFFRCAARPSCDFFLWEDRARRREKGLPGDQGTADDVEELPPRPRTPSFTQPQLTAYGIQVTPGRRLSDGDITASSDDGEDARAPAADTPCPPRSKRKHDSREDSGDDSFGALDSDDEMQMAILADTVGSKARASSQPNLKTPTAPRNVDAMTGLPTPSTSRTLFPDAASRSNKRQKTVSFEEAPETPSKPPTAATSSSATTQRTAPAPAPAGPSSSPPTSSPSSTDAIHDPTDEIMALLRPHSLDQSVMQSVRSVIGTSVRRARGVAMGREAARTAVREKDARIAELRERVAALENKDRITNSQITNMKAGIMRLWEEN